MRIIQSRGRDASSNIIEQKVRGSVAEEVGDGDEKTGGSLEGSAFLDGWECPLSPFEMRQLSDDLPKATRVTLAPFSLFLSRPGL